VLTLPAAVRIYVAAEAVDLRRGFDGLAATTRSLFRQDPLDGHLFVSLNRNPGRRCASPPDGVDKGAAGTQKCGRRPSGIGGGGRA
jgi:hypothetical protein